MFGRRGEFRIAALILFILAAIAAFASIGTIEQELGLSFAGFACLVVAGLEL